MDLDPEFSLIIKMSVIPTLFRAETLDTWIIEYPFATLATMLYECIMEIGF